MKLSFRFSLLIAIVLTAPFASSQAAEKFNDTQRQEIDKMIRSYIMENPQVILDSVQIMQAQAEEGKKDLAKKNLVSSRDTPLNDPNTPTSGNPKGDVTIVEYFEYRSGYCKRVVPTLMKAVKDDGNGRVVYKEFPILGPESAIASRASLAVWKIAPKKYEAFHTALMANKSSFSELKIRSIASNLKIDGNAVIKVMKSESIEADLGENHALAQSLGISGTPAFIIGNELVPGAVDLDTLKGLIKKARGS